MLDLKIFSKRINDVKEDVYSSIFYIICSCKKLMDIFVETNRVVSFFRNFLVFKI